MSASWPVVLRDRELELRPLRRSDRRAFERLRADNADWLTPWDASDPDPRRRRLSFPAMRRWMEDAARRGAMLPLAITVDDQLVGQVTAGPIQYGSASSAQIGYWIARSHAGMGLAPRAVALVMDHCFVGLGLHRVQIDVRPENAASLRVVEKLHLRDEGLRRGLIHVDGAWRDHRSFALTAEEVRGDDSGAGVLARLRAEVEAAG